MSIRGIAGVDQSKMAITGGTASNLAMDGSNTISGASAAQLPTTLFILRGANLVATADQLFSKVANFTNYVLTDVIAVTKSGGATVACVGGIYTAAAKAGDQIVSAVQSWIGLSSIGLTVRAALANLLLKLETAIPVLSLTTASATAATADLFLIGLIAD